MGMDAKKDFMDSDGGKEAELIEENKRKHILNQKRISQE
jgi:hypothetical protein